jgi:YaiO family outer membrane protein
MTAGRWRWPAACLLPVVLALPSQTMAEAGNMQDENSTSIEEVDVDIRSLQERLATGSENTALRAELARLLSRAGRYQEALGEYDALIHSFPEDVDHALGKAQLLFWLEDYAKAMTELERAKRLAPDYEAVWQLQLAVMQRRRHETDSARIMTLRNEAEARFPNSAWWRIPQPRRVPRWLLTLGAGYENLSNDLPDWNSQFLQLDWRRDQNSRYFARLARDARFDNADPQIALGGEWGSGDKWTGGLEFNTSTTANFQPKTGASLHVGRRLAAGWGVDLRWRQRRYDTAIVSTFTSTAERYFGNFRAAYGLNLSHLHGLGDTVAHTLTFNWYVGEKHSFGIVVADGEEAEAVGTGQVLQTDVTSATFSGRHLLSDRHTLAWWVGSHRQGDLYRRDYVGLAITIGI